jgi:hypothetical protein
VLHDTTVLPSAARQSIVSVRALEEIRRLVELFSERAAKVRLPEKALAVISTSVLPARALRA